MKYIPQTADVKDFPTSINLADKKYQRVKRWIRWRYPNYSEHLIIRYTLRNYPADVVEAHIILSDTWAVMPSVVYDHFETRLAAYIVKNIHGVFAMV